MRFESALPWGSSGSCPCAPPGEERSAGFLIKPRYWECSQEPHLVLQRRDLFSSTIRGVCVCKGYRRKTYWRFWEWSWSWSRYLLRCWWDAAVPPPGPCLWDAAPVGHIHIELWFGWVVRTTSNILVQVQVYQENIHDIVTLARNSLTKLSIKNHIVIIFYLNTFQIKKS